MDAWKKLLETAVADRWRTGQCFLIAQVKPLLTSNGIEVEEQLAGRQMRHFLEAEAPELRQIVNEHQPTNWGLVPPGEPIERPYAQYFSAKGRKPPTTAEFPYQNALRIAFGKAIGDGLRRYVLHTPARFVDVPGGEVAAGGVEVTPDDLAVGGADTEIATRIAAWIGRNALPATDYQPTRSSVTKSTKLQSTALHDLIDLLPPADLARVTLPLDVVRKLLAKPGTTAR